MNITEIVSTDYTEFSPDTTVSKLASAFEDPDRKSVV